MATVEASSFGSCRNEIRASLPRCHGATIAVRLPDSSDWFTQPSEPSESRTLRQLSYSWMISMGSPGFR